MVYLLYGYKIKNVYSIPNPTTSVWYLSAFHFGRKLSTPTKGLNLPDDWISDWIPGWKTLGLIEGPEVW